jgi:putative CocE/NonD family hydrolase
MNPMVDGWRGDDWFHNGAFRQEMMSYIYEQEATRSNDIHWPIAFEDDYDLFMQAGSAGELGRERGLDQLGFWRKILAHPSYDAFWQQQAMDKILAREPLKVPTLIVAGLWDQEDIYGAMAVYRSVEPKDTQNNLLYLAIGPWYHGQQISDGNALGAIRFGSDTALWFRQHVLAPFLAHYLKDGAPPMDVAPVTAFETGINEWERLKGWPQTQTRKLYLEPGLEAGFSAPAAGEAYDEYVSDPRKPVPYRPRPNRYPDPNWHTWLTGDQREVSGRPDVLAFVSDTLTEPLAISGEPIVNLVASTTGTDGDWVVKLIDEYPPEVAVQPEMGGYQLMISADIFRGRYRESLETPKAIAPNEPLVYRFALPTANHVFLRGHRIMLQVQSGWFPLYDRNPQTFVPSIFAAKPGDYRKATIRIYHAPGRESAIELPVVAAAGTSAR